jgi:hypothetical protein
VPDQVQPVAGSTGSSARVRSLRTGSPARDLGQVALPLRKNSEKYLAGILENLTTLDGWAAVRRLGGDLGKVTEFLLCCQCGRGFLIDLRAPTDVSSDVAQPTLILATRNDGAVSFDHAEYVAAMLPA